MKLFHVYVSVLIFGLLFLSFYFKQLSRDSTVLAFFNIKNSSNNANKWLNNKNLSNNANELQEILQCFDKPIKPSIEIRGSFWVFYNFVRAEIVHKCHESVTYTTVGDYLHVDNLIPIVERWNGPVSVALHAVGFDFYRTLDSIAYLRNCNSSLIKKFVTFHIVMDYDHLPEPRDKGTPLSRAYKDEFDCNQGPPFMGVERKNMYKTQEKVKFPINVLRNVARETAQTHFVLAADIELYPSEKVVKHFLKMVVEQKQLFAVDARNVFVLPVFEVKSDQNAPLNKTNLIDMYNKKNAIKFHASICHQCHTVPKFSNWLKLPVGENLNVFTSTKRINNFRIWEPFYIGTNFEPSFEERISWEHGADKMTQNYKQCLLGYNYWVLDNAFLVHRPGIKVFNSNNPDKRNEPSNFTKNRLNNEYVKLFGRLRGC